MTGATPAFAETPWSGFIEPALHSQWRFGGLPFTDTPVFQTKLVGCKDTVCGVLYPTYVYGTDELIEMDYALLKIVPFEESTLVLGYGHYEISGAPSTNEVFAEYERGPWKTKVFFDFVEGDNGWFVDTTYTKEFGPLEAKITGGDNHEYYLFDGDKPESAFYGNLTLATPVDVGEGTLKPYITFQKGQKPLDDDTFGGVIYKREF